MLPQTHFRESYGILEEQLTKLSEKQQIEFGHIFKSISSFEYFFKKFILYLEAREWGIKSAEQREAFYDTEITVTRKTLKCWIQETINF